MVGNRYVVDATSETNFADMSFIDTISEKVTVLAQGAILAEGTLAEVQANEDVIEKYLGR